MFLLHMAPIGRLHLQVSDPLYYRHPHTDITSLEKCANNDIHVCLQLNIKLFINVKYL